MAKNQDSNQRRRAVHVISVAAELAGVHPQTLRIYERKGLVDPGVACEQAAPADVRWSPISS